MDKQITSTTNYQEHGNGGILETRMMFQEEIEIKTDKETIETPAIKIWSSRKYNGDGPYQTLAFIGTPRTASSKVFYTKETNKQEEMMNQHYDVVNHFQKMYLNQK